MLNTTLRTCPEGHQYYKSSSCPTCPICESVNAPGEGLLSALGAPARRALQQLGVTNAKQLSKFTQKEILDLHGMGPASIPKLRAALTEAGLDFRK